MRPLVRPIVRRIAFGVLAVALPTIAPLRTARSQLRDGFRSTVLPRGDDLLSPFIDFGFAVDIRGGTYTSAGACMNGYLTLALPGGVLQCSYGPGDPSTLPAFGTTFGTAVVGAYRDFNSTPAASGRLAYGSGTVDGHQAFGFAWDGISSYQPDSVTTPPPRNYLQLVFVDRSATFGAGAFDLEYDYGALAEEGGVGGVADDGGFSGVAYDVAVTPRSNSRVVQCFRGGSIADQGCASVAVVPEPSTIALTVVGLGLFAGAVRRRA